jgi:dihydropteroate synthase
LNVFRPWRLRDRVLVPRAGSPLVVGIVNVTPDSFFDGGRHSTLETALEHGRKLSSEGADLLDVGGESTRPGADPVSVQEEIQRTIPVVRELVRGGAVVSIDTRRPEVARAALDAGAHAVNDVSGLGDERMLALCREHGAGACAMHMRGDPRTMQILPEYLDVVDEVGRFLSDAAARWRNAGLPPDALALDPGIGFGKLPEHNHALVAATRAFRERFPTHPWYLGLSRKSWISRLPDAWPDSDRLAGSLGGALAAASLGCDILRVHDVAATQEAWRAFQALRGEP